MNYSVIRGIFTYIILALFIWSSVQCSTDKKDVPSNTDEVLTDTSSQPVGSLPDTILILSPEGRLIRKFTFHFEEQSRLDQEFSNTISGYPDLDTIIGDFNGDGEQETAWIQDRTSEEYFKCNDSSKYCRASIEFSDNSIQNLVIDYCAYCPAIVWRNEGDLNGDGSDEIGILPSWFTSGCRTYYVYTMSNPDWELMLSIGTAYNMREAGIRLVERDRSREGYVLVRHEIGFDDYKNFNSLPESEDVRVGSCSHSHVIERSIRLN